MEKIAHGGYVFDAQIIYIHRYMYECICVVFRDIIQLFKYNQLI